MKKIVLTLFLSTLFVLGVNGQEKKACCVGGQEKGDWYVGTGNIADKAWTEWSIAPTVGYGLTDNLMVGLNVSQAVLLQTCRMIYMRDISGEDILFM